jgi:hypothetical protein
MLELEQKVEQFLHHGVANPPETVKAALMYQHHIISLFLIGRFAVQRVQVIRLGPHACIHRIPITYMMKYYTLDERQTRQIIF